MAMLFELIRLLRTSPIRVLAVIASMAAGIASSVAALTIAHVAVVKPLPFPDSASLYHVGLYRKSDPHAHPSGGLLESEAEELVHEFSDLSEVAAFRTGSVVLGGDGYADRLGATFATDSLLRVLGISPAIGGFPEHGYSFDRNEPGVLISDAFWRSRLDSGRVDFQSLRFNRGTTRISGVLPQWFTFPENQSVIVPVDLRLDGRSDGFSLVIRLSAGVTKFQIDERLTHWREARSRQDYSRWKDMAIGVEPLSQMFVNRSDRQAIGAMVVAATITLIVALFSSAAGLAAHFISGIRVVALKLALGATRQQITKQSGMLAAAIGLASAIAAVPLSHRAVSWMNDRIVMRGDFASPPWLRFDIGLEATVWTILGAVLLAAVLGMSLSWRMTRLSIATVLSDPSRTHPGAWFVRVLRILLVTQAITAAALAIIAGGLQLGMQRTMGATTNLTDDSVVVGTVELDPSGYPDGSDQSRFIESFASALERRFGSGRVGLSSVLPEYDAERAEYTAPHLGGSLGSGRLQYGAIGPGFAQVYASALTAGRLFDESDSPNSAPVAIVDERFSQLHGEFGQVLGAQVELWPNERHSPLVTIVGIIKSVSLLPGGSEGRSDPVLLRPLSQNPHRRLFVSLRLSSELRSSVESELRDAIFASDPMIPSHSVRSLAQLRGDRVAGLAIFTDLVTAIGALVLALSCCGMYVIFSYRAITRVRDIAICQGLGASPVGAMWFVMRGDLIALACSLSAGTVIGLFGLHLIRRMFAEMPIEILTADVLMAVLAVAVAGLLAVYRPLRIAAGRSVLQSIRQD